MLTVALSLALAGALPPPPQDAPRGPALRPRSVTLPDEVVHVPMRMRGVQPAVEVTVNGRGPYLFAIDTGGGGAARVDASLLEALELEVVDRVRGADPTGRPGPEMPVVELESIALGGARFEGVRALSRDYNRSPSLPHIDGILGYHLFDGCALTLDYAGREVRVERSPYAFPEGAATIPLTSGPDEVPAFTLRLGGVEVRGVYLDTGKMGGLGVPPAVAEQLEFGEPLQVVGRARSVTGEFEIRRGRVKGALELGGLRVEDPEVDTAEVLPVPVLGSSLLAPYVVTVDPASRRLWIRTPEEDRRLRREDREQGAQGTAGQGDGGGTRPR